MPRSVVGSIFWDITLNVAYAGREPRVCRNSKTPFGNTPVVATGIACRSSSPTSTGACAAGLNISNTATTPHSLRWTNGYACVCAPFFVSGEADVDQDAVLTINAGPTLSLRNMGCSRLPRPIAPHANP